jgi:hypothetical protein
MSYLLIFPSRIDESSPFLNFLIHGFIGDVVMSAGVIIFSRTCTQPIVILLFEIEVLDAR